MDKKIAIVGMAAIFGPDEDLDAFGRTIYDGSIHRPALPVEQETKKRKRSKFEYKESCFQRLSDDERASVKVMLEKVINGALDDAKSKDAENSWNRLALILLADHELPQLHISPEKLIFSNSLPSALQTARDLLAAPEVKGVILAAVHLEEVFNGTGPHRYSTALDIAPTMNGLPPGQGVGALFLKDSSAAQQAEDRIYAVIEAMAFESCPSEQPFPSSPMIRDVCKRSFDAAGIAPGRIELLEISTKGLEEDQMELKGLIEAYQVEEDGLTCALGCVKDNIANNLSHLSLAGLIKTALCLYHRYIPAVPEWMAPANKALLEKSPFYIATESKTWFLQDQATRRTAAISHIDTDGVAHLIMSNEDNAQIPRPNRYLSIVSPYCFPLAGEDQADLINQLHNLEKIIETTVSLPQSTGENLAAFEKRVQCKYALMLVGHTREELITSARFMMKSIPDAMAKGTAIKMPKGSYFTANPLGRKGKVAFVYPGVGSAYIGLGQHLFHLFPEIYYPFSLLTPNIGELLMDELLYPRSRERLTEDQIWKMELALRKYFMAISKSGIGFFVINTMILKDTFKVQPDQAIGYSMGEPGMMASLEVWQDPGQLVDKTYDSPTFMRRLHGELDVLREFWQIDTANKAPDEKLWDSYTLQVTPEVAEEAIKDESRVFLTIINAPEEVVIAGDPESCLRVIKKIDCKYYPLSLDLIIHCDPARLEYDNLAELYTLPTKKNPGIKFYSSSYYKPLPTESRVIGQSIAKAFCEVVDFPRLIRQAYEDGARIFIEVGSRKFCCNLIDKILMGKEYLATPINVKGTTDQISIVRVLAQLVSHRVPVNLSPLM